MIICCITFNIVLFRSFNILNISLNTTFKISIMKKGFLLFLVFAAITFHIKAQDFNPNEPIWGLYASGVGEKLSPCMDPCWVTYTVAPDADTTISANVAMGLMGAVITGVTWREATAAQRNFGRYFEDEPDGTWKCVSCEFSLRTGIWGGWGTMVVTGGGTTIRGTYSDTYSKPELGTVEIHRNAKGKWEGTWAEPAIGRKGTLYDIIISKDGKTISGKYDTTADGGKKNWHKGSLFTWKFKSPNVKH